MPDTSELTEHEVKINGRALFFDVSGEPVELIAYGVHWVKEQGLGELHALIGELRQELTVNEIERGRLATLNEQLSQLSGEMTLIGEDLARSRRETDGLRQELAVAQDALDRVNRLTPAQQNRKVLLETAREMLARRGGSMFIGSSGPEALDLISIAVYLETGLHPLDYSPVEEDEEEEEEEEDQDAVAAANGPLFNTGKGWTEED
jgi:hypothetical protein